MKKKFFLIGALVAMSMSAMFVACEKKDNGLEKGCNCTFYEEGETWTEYISPAEMMNYGATSCSALASALQGAHRSHGITVSINCQ